MKICIPHYTRLVERRAVMEAALERMGLEATWITAYDQEDITEETVEASVDQRPLRERASVTEQAMGGRLYPEKPLRLSEISIALKQLDILRHHAESPEGFVVVLEDDVEFRSKRFPEEFRQGLARTPADWDLIFFGASGIPFERRLLRRLWNRFCARTVFKKSPPATRCLDSYAITTAAAGKLAGAIGRIALPIDWELNYWLVKLGLNVYWWEPGLTSQGSQTGVFASSIRDL